MGESLTIGKVAKRANVNVETVRYYQRIGLINEPKKPKSGFRHYPLDTIERLLFFQRAKVLGFGLTEISALILLDSGKCKDV